MEIERLTVEEIKSSIIQKLERNYGCEIEDATRAQLYDALAQTVKDEVMRRRTASRGERKRQKCQEACIICPPSFWWDARCTTTWSRS